MKLWPAIDLKEGRVVRLLKGELSRETAFEIGAQEAARRFEAEGADGLHIVDLDAAFSRGDNTRTIESMLRAVKLPVQVGGGLRSREAVRRVLAAGAARAVLGSLPFTAPELFAEIAAEDGPRIVAALDCRGGRPTVHGWTESAGGDASSAARHLAASGIAALLVTDVERDGTLEGPNLDLLAAVRAAFPGEVQASGGVRGAEDLPDIERVLAGGPAGVIIGRALHAGLTTLAKLRGALGR